MYGVYGVVQDEDRQDEDQDQDQDQDQDNTAVSASMCLRTVQLHGCHPRLCFARRRQRPPPPILPKVAPFA